ncbi:MAG: hypothetical protein HRT89_17155, partial [Lentisphaeria bacterium]|nr:hypothetical protein [Lentisphaeria bacterium]
MNSETAEPVKQQKRSFNRTLLAFKEHVQPVNLLAFALAIIITLPLLVIVAYLFVGEAKEWGHISKYLLPHYLKSTVLLLLGVIPLSILLGVGTAWLVSVYRFPFRRVFEWALILPLAIPTYIVAFSYVGLFDFTGPVNQVYQKIAGPEAFLSIDVQTMPGLICVISFVLYPYIYLISRISFQR